MLFEEALNVLKRNLKKPLPARQAHKLMLPVNRILNIDLSINPFHKKSGVAVILYPENGQTNSILIERASYKGMHSGQIAFPGGKKEKIDKNLTETALRETQEEIGIKKENFNIIGCLSQLYIPPSNYMVQPVVFSLNEKPSFVPDEKEVNAVITYNIESLLKHSFDKKKIFTTTHYSIEAPYFDINGYTVWGATAMMLSELKILLESKN